MIFFYLTHFLIHCKTIIRHNSTMCMFIITCIVYLVLKIMVIIEKICVFYNYRLTGEAMTI